MIRVLSPWRARAVAALSLAAVVVATGCEGPALSFVVVLKKGSPELDTSGVRSALIRLRGETLEVQLDPAAREQPELAFTEEPPAEPVAVHVAACLEDDCEEARAAFLGCSAEEVSAATEGKGVDAFLYAPGSADAEECNVRK